VSTGAERAVDHDVEPGVEADLGDSEARPPLRLRLLAADAFLLATPTADAAQLARPLAADPYPPAGQA
jgi:hypothetical protein